jgi:hypothetical protein
MDRKVALLAAFYGGLPKDRAKLETPRHGFDFLAELLADGIVLEYGELTLSGLLHKYKLAGIPPHRLEGFLADHVAKAANVCLYFGERENNVFCFNLDNNHRENNRELIPEMEFAVRRLDGILRKAGCEPLIVASGRGYHVWGRLEGPVANARLYEFMLRAAVATVAALHARGSDHHRVKFNFYPDPRTRDVVSLRLFGSQHAKNGVFSHILTPEGLLSEDASWDYFADYLANKTIPVARFEAALQAFVQAT